MKKIKNGLIILMVVSAVSALIWLPKLKPAKKVAVHNTKKVAVPNTNGSNGSLPTEKMLPAELFGSVRYTGNNNRDPLDNSAAVAQQETEVQQQKPDIPLPQLSVSAVIWGSQRPQAIINSKVVCIGETIEGVKIVNIGKEGIRIDFNGEETVLPTK